MTYEQRRAKTIFVANASIQKYAGYPETQQVHDAIIAEVRKALLELTVKGILLYVPWFDVDYPELRVKFRDFDLVRALGDPLKDFP